VNGRAYVCSECGYRFRGPGGRDRDARTPICPACGSFDVDVLTAVGEPVAVMRARVPAASAGGGRRSWWRPRLRRAS
jgi:rubredoxin